MTAAELLDLLPTFERWTARHAAEAVAAQAANGRSLLEVMHAVLDERARLQGTLALGSPIDQLFVAVTGAAPDRRAARAIADGRLGRAALADRVAVEVSRREGEARVAFLAACALERRHGLSAAADRAAELLSADASWRLARVGLEALAERASPGHWPSNEALARARVLAASSEAPTWTQVAAIDLLAVAAPQAAFTVASARLRADRHPDDRFVRPAAARALARLNPAAARSLIAAALPHDASEHVRMELIKVLGTLGAADVLRERTDPAGEPSPRVRAVACIAIASLDPAALVPVLERDPDELPRQIALEEAESLSTGQPALVAAIEGLASGRTAVTPAVARLAAEAAERLHHRRDGEAALALRAVRSVVAGLEEGGRRPLGAPVSPAALGRALAVAGTDDLGLEAWPTRRGFTVARGDRMRWRLWRALHELRHPGPDKRPGHPHTIGRAPKGPLRAPPGGLAEVTATRVPGERVLVPALGDWGRHLPTVDDLLDRPRGGVAYVFNAFGVTQVAFPRTAAARARARAALTLRYAYYAELRARSLAANEAPGRGVFVAAIERLGYAVTFCPHRGAAPGEILDVLRGAGGSAPAALSLAVPPLAALLHGVVDPATSGVGHLAAVAAAALGLFVARQHETRSRIERARAAIPLSLGGWGTRGKSGTERLKAALFQGLGCEVLAKTTGCEAMVIHAVPGVRAQELFVYRPYDKATIWEQQPLLELAARLGVDVFLWECMALRPEYVRILEQQWMRDPVCTLTNTYPDHENIQGPAGIDIPRAMVDFIPRGSHLLTAEDSMLPLLRDAAASRQTVLQATTFRDHALLPADLLARFPYEEHPRNIALVLALARLLGVPSDMALKEMADWVVPDLGVLKTYPEARRRDRRLVFSNGMSANERTGFVNNWQRLGFDQLSPAGEWVVTVINNREDRVSRSEVFADVMVADGPAHAQVLIGTNLPGLLGYVARALAAHLRRVVLFHREEATLDADRLEALAAERAARALVGVRLTAIGASALAASARAMAHGIGLQAAAPEAAFERALAAALASPHSHAAELETTLAPVLREELAPFAAVLGPHAADAVAHLARATAQHAAVLRWRSSLRQACSTGRGVASCERAFRVLYADLFRATLVVLDDPHLSGDQIVDAIARVCPPGYRVRILGAQNIKGTGLDFVHRWIAFDRTLALAAALERSSGDAALAIAAELASSEDTGILDGPVALAALQAAATREPERIAEALAAPAAAIARRQSERESALQSSRRQASPILSVAERFLDVYDGIRRRRRADAIMEDLARGHIDHTAAATALHTLVDRQKGGWLSP